MFNTKYPYVLNINKYETDNILITVSGRTSNTLWHLLFGAGAMAVNGTAVITFAFKNKTVTPNMINMEFHQNGGCWWTGSSAVTKADFCVDYFINNEWVTKVTHSIASGEYAGQYIELPAESTTQIRCRFGASATLTRFDLDFKTESPMIKNKVENTIMQNEFFQSVLPKMEVE